MTKQDNHFLARRIAGTGFLWTAYLAPVAAILLGAPHWAVAIGVGVEAIILAGYHGVMLAADRIEAAKGGDE